ncbi:MAG: helix-turn-helix domain-containing protein [Mizugakiibacter sp.]|uniref:GlxA family transcriptional regulator n=1 Tax=Mizugakiibacter sp. TaxID=1972610 RepID=UPI0031BFF8BC|nr:DJ-1/PfpI family protein [Xanthomonadaceae bacterium]
MPSSPATDVWFVLPPGVVLLDFAGAAEAFRIAADFGAGFRPRVTAAIEPGQPVPTSLGLGLVGVEPPPEAPDADALLIVCGAAGDAGASDSRGGRAIARWLRRVGPGRRLACICSGALMAARAGLLDGRRCTTHHTLIDALRQAAPHAEVLDSRVFVEDGGVYTSAGITAGIDLALHLIAEMASPRLSADVAREMVVYLRRAPDDPALSPWLQGRNHLDMRVHRVQDALARAPQRDWPLERLAELGHMSVRTLTRRFRDAAGMSVHDYHARLRVALARQALAAGDSVEAAAAQAGLASARQLRRLWAVHAEATPGLHRRRSA